ncbi:hypothetical protein Tco_0714522 [Tanacetum coccineum]
MLATRRYAQWQSHVLRYIDTRPNGDALRKCILECPYIPSIVRIPAVPATDDSPEVPERTAVETILNMYPEQAQRDKDLQKNLALIAKYFKKIYKPTNNNLRTFSNSKNKNVDTSSRYKNDNQTGKPKGQKTTLITRKKCCCANKLRKVPIADSGTDTEPLEQVQYDAEYNVFTNKRQHYEQPGSINNTCVVEKADSNIIPNSPDMYGYSKNRKKMVKTGQTQTRDGKECTRAEDLIARKVKSQLQSNLGQESTH